LLCNGLRPPLTREPLRACRAGERADGHLPGYGAANMMNVSRGAVGALKHQVNQEIGCVEHPQKPEESPKNCSLFERRKCSVFERHRHQVTYSPVTRS